MELFNKQKLKLRKSNNLSCTYTSNTSVISGTLPLADMELDWAEERPLDLNGNFLLTGFALTNYTLEQNVVSYRQTGIVFYNHGFIFNL